LIHGGKVRAIGASPSRLGIVEAQWVAERRGWSASGRAAAYSSSTGASNAKCFDL